MKYLLLFSVLLTHTSFAGELILKFKNLRSENGSIRIALWDQAQGFPKDYRTSIDQISIIAKENSKVTFSNLKPGEYAAAIFHDENNDEDLNTNWIGIPKEGFGFTNNPRLITGPPNFRKCKIKIKLSQKKEQTIYLKFL